MGRGILIAVVFVLAAGGYLLIDAQRAALETREQQGDYQFHAVARSTGYSAFDHGFSLIKREGMKAVGAFSGHSMGEGTYDLTITSNLYGDFDVVVDANSDAAEYDVEGNVIYTAPLPAAFAIDDDELDVQGGGAYTVSGVDRRMPSRTVAAGYRAPVPGIWTRTSHVAPVSDALNTSQVLGLGAGEKKVDVASINGAFENSFYEELYQEVLGLPSSRVRFAAGQVPEGAVRNAAQSSSAGDPTIIRVQGDLQITQPLEGYGLLIVEEGDLNVMTNSFDWEGLVMLRKANKDTVRVRLADGSRIHGGMAIYDRGGPSLWAECVPQFVIDGNETVVQDSFRVFVEVIGAAISYGGEYEIPVTARVNIGNQVFQPWGSFDQALSGNVNTNDRFVFSPDVVFPPGAVSIDARSWVKKSDMSGATDDEWRVYMEKNASVLDQQLTVLHDGMPVPSVPGFLDQSSVVEFIAAYVDGSDMDLRSNETINLFELGTTNLTSSAFDLQDLVVMISVVDATVNGCSPGRGASRTEVNLGSGAQVHYSTEAIAKLSLHLDTIRGRTEATVAHSAVRSRAEGEKVIIDRMLTADDQEDDAVYGQGGHPGSETLTVCHKPHKNGGDTKTIKRKDLGKHIGHGDYAGSCSAGDD